MKAVRNKATGRLVYREYPDFRKGMGIANALLGDLVAGDLGSKDELEEIDITQEQWDAEIALREQEKGPTAKERLDDLDQRVKYLEKTPTPISPP